MRWDENEEMQNKIVMDFDGRTRAGAKCRVRQKEFFVGVSLAHQQNWDKTG